MRHDNCQITMLSNEMPSSPITFAINCDFTNVSKTFHKRKKMQCFFKVWHEFYVRKQTGLHIRKLEVKKVTFFSHIFWRHLDSPNLKKKKKHLTFEKLIRQSQLYFLLEICYKELSIFYKRMCICSYGVARTITACL